MNPYELTHFSHISTVPKVQVPPYIDQPEAGMKPEKSFWLSDETEHGWKQWCLDEEFQVQRLRHQYRVTLDPNVCTHLATPEEIRAFDEEYGTPLTPGSRSRVIQLAPSGPGYERRHHHALPVELANGSGVILVLHLGLRCRRGPSARRDQIYTEGIMNFPSLFTVQEVAERLNMKPRQVRLMVSKGMLPAYKMGGILRIHPNEVLNLLKRSRTVQEEGK